MAKPTYGVDSISDRSPKRLIAAVVGILIVLGIVAMAFSLSKKDNSADKTEFQPVTIAGPSLPAEFFNPGPSQALNEQRGAQAPTLVGKGFGGETVTIGPDVVPKVVIFFAHWDTHSQVELDRLSKWLKRNRDAYRDVQFFAVATGTKPDRANFPPSAWFDNAGWKSPVLVDTNDSKAAGAFGLGDYPYIVLLDKDNKVVTRTSGELSVADFEVLLRRIA